MSFTTRANLGKEEMAQQTHHSCYLLGRVPKPWAQPKIADTEVVVSVINSYSERGANTVSHKLLFLFERILLSRAIEFWPFDGADRDTRISAMSENWRFKIMKEKMFLTLEEL
jgi:hypothetical protein